MNMNSTNPFFQQLSGESRGDSFLTISPTKKKRALAKINLKSNHSTNQSHGKYDSLKSNVKISSLTKPLITSSLDSLSNDIKKATKSGKSSKKQTVSKETKTVKFVSEAVTLTPAKSKKNNKAAIEIQRIARGGFQRLKFRIALLQHKLDTKDELTKASIRRIEEHTQQRKNKFRRQLEQQAKKELKRSTQDSTLAKESLEIKEYLRKENMKLRQKNEKIFNAFQALRHDIARLENANVSSGECFFTLNDHTKEIEETNAKLNTIVPMYKASVDKMEEAIELRRQFCLSEHAIKLTYVKAMGKVVEMMEDNCRDPDLVDEIVEYCLNVEGEENTTPLPSKLGKFFADERDGSASSDEEYDEYTVASMD
jgi:hypothetical protein